MSRLLTLDDKLAKLKTMYESFTKAQVDHLDSIDNVDARYTCAMRYVRELNKGKKGELVNAEKAYKRFKEVIDGLGLIEDKCLTDEKQIKYIINLLDGYADKGVKLIDENNRRHLERLKLQRTQLIKEYEARREKYDQEIAELEQKLS